MLDSARRTVIKLTTSSHRALLKKLPEMTFQMMYGHDCYRSHETWTVFCKGIVALAFQASRAVKEGRDDYWDDARAADMEVEPPGEQGDSDGEGGAGVMDALNEERGALAPVVGDGAAGAGASAASGGGAPQPETAFRATPEYDLRTNWLHRGGREPLASMGVYHYAMYVYAARGCPLDFDAEDFVTYAFADAHPAAGSRVQKLRVGAPFKVPRLFGFTMPAKEKDPEVNALFKSVLFRPLWPAAQGAARWAPFRAGVDAKGSHVEPWGQR